jgi:hypothetical protein|nr:MAG TPA: hypothetical protein [Caudoviricetes sp.]
MTFETIINTANARATALGKTLIFGDTAVQNVAANELSDDFFTLDITSGSYTDTNVPGSSAYTVVIRCMGTSAYMRDDAVEIATLIRTDLLLHEMLKSFICGYEIGSLRIIKVQNQYDTIKSGWEATFDAYKYGA